MKAEEKFPLLVALCNLLSDQEIEEVRELFAAWDAQLWQPIDTAPKDGSEIELWDGSVRRARWGDRIVGKINLPCFLSRGITVAYPTHWRPLPKGPQ